MCGMRQPVTQKDIAEKLGVDFDLVRSWKARGMLPATPQKIGGRPVWEWAKIEAWWRDRQAKPHPGRPVTTK
jgi:uncharacterized protein YjcR